MAEQEPPQGIASAAATKPHRLKVADLIKLSTRIFTVKPMRTFLTIFGTSIGISTVVFLISLGYGLQYVLLGKLVTTQDSLLTIQAYYPQESGLQILSDHVTKIAELPEAAEVSPLGEFQGEITAKGSTGLIPVRTIRENYFRLSGTIPGVGEQISTDKPGVIITLQTARILNLPEDAAVLGQQVNLALIQENNDGSQSEPIKTKADLPILGVIDDEVEPPLAYVLYDSLDKDVPFYKEVYVKARDVEQVNPVREKLLEQGFLISARLDLVNQAGKILTIITIVLGVFGIAALVVSAVGMFNTMIVSFLERIYEVGVMKSLGATDGDVRNLFLMESLMMGLAGGVTGVALGMGAGEFLNLGFNILARRMGGEPVDLFITPWWFVALCLGSSALIGLFAGFWPAKRATGLSPKEAFLRK